MSTAAHPTLVELARTRVVVIDGGMGTSLHQFKPTEGDWGYAPNGKSLLNLSDTLAYTHPEWISAIHEGYFEAGCDAVETNTFNANLIGLSEFGVAEQLDEINRLNVKLAKDAAAKYTTPERKRYVIGSVGPGTKMPSLTDAGITTDFDAIVNAYRPQLETLVDSGVDAILIETCFDILQAKAVAITAVEVMESRGVKLPLMVQITIMEQGQKMLPGTDIAGALVTLASLPGIDVIGLNCAVGPDLMLSSVQHLSQSSPRLISVVPNAGLPVTRGDDAFFPLQPDDLADWLDRFVTEFGVNIVGGCCGTTKLHMKAVCDRLMNKVAPPRTPELLPCASSLLGAMELGQQPRPLLVGERTNTNGSRKFKQLLEKDDFEGLLDMAREQEREGVHILDVSVAYVGRDEERDMKEVLKRYNAVLSKPIMIDSTEVNVIEAALKLCSGKAIINSINLEDGREKLDKVVPLARKYGAALVALTIDEVGQADTAQWKFDVAKRIYDICVHEYGIPPTDLMFDPLVFPVSTGQEQTRKSAVATFDAIKLIKQGLPGALTHVGLSNCSFGLAPYARQVLNSVYLHHALEYGCDSAILHAAKIIPLATVDEEGRELCRRLLFDERVFDANGECTEDPLQLLIEHYSDRKGVAKAKESLGETVEARLKQAIIQGRRETLSADLDAGREKYTPIDIINNILLDGMKVVGELFGSGQMQLPFVLQSAEVMKAAVAMLEPHMEKTDGAEKGKIVLATVKGDVHDIGKNLVDIILTNNGYKVYNIGIKQPVENMISELEKTDADAIGMSGLLVKSTVIMKEDLVTLNKRGLKPPVILGGAALNRRYVEEDLRRIYQGQLFYGEDAFEGLRIMDQLVQEKRLAATSPAIQKVIDARQQSARSEALRAKRDAAQVTTKAEVVPVDEVRSEAVRPAPNRPRPPFFGYQPVSEFDVATVFNYINERTLFSTQWQYRKGGVKPAEYEKQMNESARPALARLKALCLEHNILQPAATYGFYPAASRGNSIDIYDHNADEVTHTFTFPRQDFGERLCLADYIAPPENGRPVDSIGLMAVTAGEVVSQWTEKLRDEGKFTDYYKLHGLGVEFAEALAEYFHAQIRREWGICADDARDITKLFKGHYRGRRYAFGYPACPRLEDQLGLFKLIEPQRVGITLTEQFLLEPEQSTTALIFHHPQAKYFGVERGQMPSDDEGV